jgi:hypothetical protein
MWNVIAFFFSMLVSCVASTLHYASNINWNTVSLPGSFSLHSSIGPVLVSYSEEKQVLILW